MVTSKDYIRRFIATYSALREILRYHKTIKQKERERERRRSGGFRGKGVINIDTKGN